MTFIINLWGSWLVIYIATQVLTNLGMMLLINVLAQGKGTIQLTKRRARWLIGGVVLLAVAINWVIAQTWFSFIDLQPVWIGVFGSLGLLVLSLWQRYRQNRAQLAAMRKKLDK